MKKDRTEKSIAPRSRAEIIFYVAAAIVALIGLTESTYLTVIFLSGETAVCGQSPDCFKVLGSAAFDYSRARRFFSWTVFAMFATTLWLLFVQAFRLHAFCRYCLFSAALVFLLTGLVVARPSSTQRSS